MNYRIKNFIIIVITGAALMLLQESCTTGQHQTVKKPVELNEQPPQSQKTPDQPSREKDNRFDSTAIMEKMSISEHIDMYRKFFFEKKQSSPREELPQVPVDLARLTAPGSGDLKVSWLGHSSLLIHMDGYTILTDPVFERRVSPVGPTRFHKTLPLAVEDVPVLDIVIVSHNHYDHLNRYSIKRLNHKTKTFIVPLKVGKLLRKWGVPDGKIIELDWWQEYGFDHELMIAATPSQHFSGRGLFDRNKTLWASWVIKTSSHRIFFSGDSGYFDGFKAIGEKYGPFDATFIECGAYNERWSSIHMFPEQTVQSHIDLRGKVLHPIHNSTFNLSLHPWYEPMERVVAAAWHKDVQLSMPVIGSIVDYDNRDNEHFWWRQSMEPLEILKTREELAAGM